VPRIGLSGKRLAAVDVQRLTGEEGTRQGEQHALSDVVGGSYPPRGVTGADIGEVVGLVLLAERIPDTGVDDAGRDGVDPDRCQRRGSTLRA
jgi:hypothetical protein